MSIETEYLSEPGRPGLFTRLARVALYLDAFQHRCFDRFGLHFIDYSVLRVLQLGGAPYQMSPGRLAEIVVRSTGGMTQLLDRLEREGLVQRSPDPSDRRMITVGLTQKGLRLTKRVNKYYVEQKNELLAHLSDEEFAQMDEAVRHLLHLLQEDFDREPEPAQGPGRNGSRNRTRLT
jgi:DNA-binding MarR family transcriptional regulator